MQPLKGLCYFNGVWVGVTGIVKYTFHDSDMSAHKNYPNCFCFALMQLFLLRRGVKRLKKTGAGRKDQTEGSKRMEEGV